METKTFIFSIVVVTITLLLFIGFVISLMLLFQKKRQQNALELEKIKHQFSQTLLSSQIEIQEQTLRNISQELHDNISQKLGLAKLQLMHLQLLQPAVDVSDTKTVIGEAIADIRALSKGMHPDRIAEIPLKESMGHEIDLVKNASPVTFKANIENDPEMLTPDQRIILFRIFQELLNNALKYANASEIEVLFTTNDTSITLSVNDNGAGLPPDYQKGIGHTSIQNRATLLKGSFHLDSTPGKGMIARVEIPIG